MLREFYKTTIPQILSKKLGKSRNVFSLPQLKKVVVNYRITDAKDQQQQQEKAQKEIMAITGQKPVLCRAKKAVSGFKLRAGDPLAYKVTIRGQRMYDFIEKLFNIVLPRIRDFKGMSTKAFDQQFNYNLVIEDQTLFPEVNLDEVEKIRSVQVSLNISASSKKEAKMLLSALGFPFSDKNYGK